MIYTLHFLTSAEYEDLDESLDTIITQDVIADSLEELHTLVEQEKENLLWEKKDSLNWYAKSKLVKLDRTLIKIKDEEGNNIKI
jgi:flagellar biosynthesis/type III secretory pathway chaperone